MSNMSTDNKKINSQVVMAQCTSLYKNYILQQKFHILKRKFYLTWNFEPQSLSLSCISWSISMVGLHGYPLELYMFWAPQKSR